MYAQQQQQQEHMCRFASFASHKLEQLFAF